MHSKRAKGAKWAKWAKWVHLIGMVQSKNRRPYFFASRSFRAANLRTTPTHHNAETKKQSGHVLCEWSIIKRPLNNPFHTGGIQYQKNRPSYLLTQPRADTTLNDPMETPMPRSPPGTGGVDAVPPFFLPKPHSGPHGSFGCG